MLTIAEISKDFSNTKKLALHQNSWDIGMSASIICCKMFHKIHQLKITHVVYYSRNIQDYNHDHIELEVT